MKIFFKKKRKTSYYDFNNNLKITELSGPKGIGKFPN
jgi:hypothetical protein